MEKDDIYFNNKEDLLKYIQLNLENIKESSIFADRKPTVKWRNWFRRTRLRIWKTEMSFVGSTPTLTTFSNLC